MTEDQWLGSTNPVAMLEFARRKVSPRKVRLFACACCRLVWHRLSDERSRRAVRTAERFADGEVSEKILSRDENEAWKLVAGVTERTPRQFANLIAWQASFRITEANPENFIHRVLRASDDQETPTSVANLLREVCGNPFQPPRVAPEWMQWNAQCVEKLAQVIYREGKFEDVPILGDALEEAGCDDVLMLSHCRPAARDKQHEHVRGCWVIDAVMGRT
jgi:hypothetical protein